MIATALTSLFMPAKVGPTVFSHFGYIHLLVLLVFYSVPTAFFAARQGNVKKHRNSMIGLYVGALVVAGLFTLMPGRLLHDWFIA
ncbi:MAG: putative membrane protein [Candidatus Azotimanducaceae bacterium]|jgi:uncharacterized membrane protein